eukprot:TRINITY_DN1686_c0_g1_i1.p1 TRINITY_DN1686_c0_g1~~TRINITY_DN1686_c0_g1_i1.p1  ORF type:complete len:115 (-),score=20.86 TRINITY_DN1686_c0_g1_i1:164-508(-)
MGKLSLDAFLTEVTRMLVKSKNSNSGTIRVTFKRASPTEKVNASLKNQPATEPLCLVRATLGSRKACTWVPFKDHARFTQQLNNILKVHIDNLKAKPKEKKKQKKDAKKSKASA